VSQVFVAVRPDFDRSIIPDGVDPISLRGGGWAKHFLSDLPRLADECLADVLFCPNGISPRDSRAVLYFQDMFHFRYDGATTSSVRVMARNLVRSSWRMLSTASAKLAVSVSRHISAEVEKRVRIPSIVIYNGVDIGEVRWTGGGDYVFVLGGIGPRKNEQTAVRAWSLIPRSVRRGTMLRIGGVEPASRRANLRDLADGLGISDEVTIGDTLPRSMYLEEISRARVVVSCSSLEAFSLPVAESLLMGAPVLCSAIVAHLELLAETGVGTSFMPRDIAHLARQLDAALSGLLPSRLQVPLAGWSWAVRGRQHVDAYSRLG
jgi:glycosyltransferase involved in cell wall biosynthesis